MKKTLAFFQIVFSLSLAGQTELFNQDVAYTRQDSLRGSITPERAWWDLLYYDLNVKVDIESKSFSGKNVVTYEVLEESTMLQIDLQSPMKINRVLQGKNELEILKEGNAHFIQLKKEQKVGSIKKLVIEFSGQPKEAEMPPWDGGVTWREDSNGLPFIATSNQGIGASIWWPCKEHGYDEPDNGLLLSITVPKSLVAVGNGRLKQTLKDDDLNTYVWEVINPINNYGVNINIGDYVHFSEVYQGEKGALDLDYWVLRENLSKAKEQFKQVPMTIEAFEYWFGPYPFYRDSYKLVEVPYLGMEHQSSVTYGNSYKNGYNGRNRLSFDWSGTGLGLKWDYIIVHETAHEWFANNITVKDVADLWVHEAFTTYSESLFTEYYFGKQAGGEYSIGTRRVIANQTPIIGDYDVNKEGSSDMYFKGNNILHTLRQIVDDDEKWRSILRGLNREFYHQTVSSDQIENYIATATGLDLTKFWNQYLRQPTIPTLELKKDDARTRYRWVNVIDGFTMPLDIVSGGESKRLLPTTEWKVFDSSELAVDENYYIEISIL